MSISQNLGGTFTIGDIPVARMGYGSMRLTGQGIWQDPADRDGAIAVARRARQLGVSLFDTAWAYGPQTNERLLADALQPYDGALIATKCGLERPAPGEWVSNGRPERLRETVEQSLKNLGVDTIDLLQMHAPDSNVPYAESIGALAELQNEGKVRHIGVSNVSVEQLATAQAVAPIVSVQNRYNVADRHSEDVLEACTTQDIAFLPYFPIAGGKLAATSRQALNDVAAKHSVSVAQVCLAWLLQKSPVVCPIPGTSSVAHLEENVAAADLELDAADIAALEDV